MDLFISAKTALLAALISGPGFGLELIDRVQGRTNGQVKLNQGSVYPALRSLEDEGLVHSYEGEPTPERGGRPRRYYEITGEGRRVVREQESAFLALLRPAGVMP